MGALPGDSSFSWESPRSDCCRSLVSGTSLSPHPSFLPWKVREWAARKRKGEKWRMGKNVSRTMCRKVTFQSSALGFGLEDRVIQGCVHGYFPDRLTPCLPRSAPMSTSLSIHSFKFFRSILFFGCGGPPLLHTGFL